MWVVKSDFDVGRSSAYQLDSVEVHALRMSGCLPRGDLAADVVPTTRYLDRLTPTRSIDLIHWHHSGIGGWQTTVVRRCVPQVCANHTSMYLDACSSALGRLQLKLLLGHADAVLSLLQEEWGRARYGAAARRRVIERFSWNAISERTLRVYEYGLGLRDPVAGRRPDQ